MYLQPPVVDPRSHLANTLAGMADSPSLIWRLRLSIGARNQFSNITSWLLLLVKGVALTQAASAAVFELAAAPAYPHFAWGPFYKTANPRGYCDRGDLHSPGNVTRSFVLASAICASMYSVPNSCSAR